MVAATSSFTVVVVERDPAARELIDQALRKSGHRVLVTGDPQEALNLGQRVRIDVLVEDAEPSGDGSSLVRALRSLQPDMRLIRVSEGDEQEHSSEFVGMVFLRRPLSLEELENALSSLVERPAVGT
jgi:DNA-binding response OmpR family regulator